MKLLKLLTICLCLLTSTNGFSQDFEVPINYDLTVAADYAKYEKDVIEATNWLRDAPFDKEKYKRKDVGAFIVQWVNGSPTVNVEIFASIMDFEKKNPGMMALYMGASSKYVLENNFSKDMRAKHRAALRDMIKAYSNTKGISKDKKMDKLVKADADGLLDEWIEKNMPVKE